MIDFDNISYDICALIPERVNLPPICLPGGICIEEIPGELDKIPKLSDQVMGLINQLGSAMAPMKPFFDMLDTILALHRCVNAVPNALMSLDPTELINCVPALAEAIDLLLQLIPQLSIPRTVRSVIRTLATLLLEVAGDLRYLQNQIDGIVDQIDQAAHRNDAVLSGLLVCAQNSVKNQAFGLAEALKGLGRIILVINIFLDMIKVDPIPCFGSLVSQNLDRGMDVVADLLEDLAELLNTIAMMIPDPQYLLTAAMEGREC